MSRPTLPNIEFKNWRGLYTKGAEDVVNPFQLRKSSNTDYFRQYGAISKVRGNKPLLPSQYTENSVVAPISWVGFFKGSDLSGQILRRIILACGSTIQLMDTSNNNTLVNIPFPDNLKTIPTKSGLPHISATQNSLLFIQNQDIHLIGNGNIPIKY